MLWCINYTVCTTVILASFGTMKLQTLQEVKNISMLVEHLGAQALLDLENHYNFAWKEKHVIGGVEREVVVHRKGATPAGDGGLGIIPGSVATPGFVVSGNGNAESLNSASYGAGRTMSRKSANEKFNWKDVNRVLKQQGVN